MTSVTNTIKDPAGTPLANATIRITLITGSTSPGYTATGEVQGTYSLSTDNTGTWTADLTPNATITPANTYYKVTEGPGNQAVSNIVVPASGGPYLLGSILVVPPTTPAALGITGVQVAANGTIAGSRPEVNVIAGSNITVSAVDNPGSSRVDVTVSASGGAPATTVQSGTAYGVTPAVGVDTTYAREDHQHGTPALASTAPATTEAIGQAAVVGVATTPARADHVHPLAAAALPGNSAVGDAAATGSSTSFAAGDHKHGRESFAAPGNSAVGDVAAAGTSASVSHADHVHGRESFGTVTALSAFGTASSNGTATSVSHSDHVHGAPALPAASTSTAGIAQFDANAAHLQPQGVAAAGSQGLAADSGHAHPLEPWRFNVAAYGAKGDGKISNTGATTATSATVTIGEAVLTVADQGKVVLVKNALNANNASGQTTSVGTITTVNSPTSFTATWNTTPTQNSTGLQVLWATDDTAAIQSAIAAANTYAQTHSGYAEIFFPPAAGLYYGVGGPLKNTDGTNAVYNSQLTIPVNAETNNGVTLVFRGPEDGGQTRYWNTDYPVWNGGIQSFGCFTSSGTQSTSISGGGNPSVIGGPTGKFNYGVLQGANTTPTYTNTCVVFQDFTILTTHVNSGWTYSAFNAFGCARLHAKNFTYGTNGVVQFYKNSPNLGDFTNVTLLSGGLSIGGLMPSNGNNASNYLQNVVCNGGYTYGLYAMEHTVANSLTVLYCWSGVCPVGSYGDSAASGTVSALHAMYFDQACVEGCTFHVNIVGVGQSGIGPIIHMVLDTEGTVQLRDSEAAGANTGAGLAAAMGEIRLTGSPSTITIQTGTGAGGLGTGLRIIKEQNLPGVPSSGIPALVDGTAVSNTLWRPATVYLSGGTNVTTVAVSRLAGGVNTVAVSNVINQAAGALPANTPIRLGPGQWIKVTTSAGTLPTAVWVLD